MAMTEDLSSDAIIIPADWSLMKKLGGVSLDKVFSSEVIKTAEQVVVSASAGFYSECVTKSAKLQFLAESFKSAGNDNAPNLKKIASVSFALKTNAGQSGYALVAALAKSLHTFCEEMKADQVTSSTRKLIHWHAQSITQLLDAKVKGDGGELGTAILAETERIIPSAQSVA